jgi:hypothetical protein
VIKKEIKEDKMTEEMTENKPKQGFVLPDEQWEKIIDIFIPRISERDRALILQFLKLMFSALVDKEKGLVVQCMGSVIVKPTNTNQQQIKEVIRRVRTDAVRSALNAALRSVGLTNIWVVVTAELNGDCQFNLEVEPYLRPIT